MERKRKEAAEDLIFKQKVRAELEAGLQPFAEPLKARRLLVQLVNLGAKLICLKPKAHGARATTMQRHEAQQASLQRRSTQGNRRVAGSRPWVHCKDILVFLHWGSSLTAGVEIRGAVVQQGWVLGPGPQ